jgi:hypothetical protein
MKVGQTVYCTRYALTKGILTRKVADAYASGRITVHGDGTFMEPGKDVFATIEDAQEKAQDMARRAIKAIDKKRRRLEEIARDGVKVST